MSTQRTLIATKVSIRNRAVHLELSDGSTHSFLVDYYPRLARVSDTALKKVKLRLGGKALRWENLDEDIWVTDAVTGQYPKKTSLASA